MAGNRNYGNGGNMAASMKAKNRQPENGVAAYQAAKWRKLAAEANAIYRRKRSMASLWRIEESSMQAENNGANHKA